MAEITNTKNVAELEYKYILLASYLMHTDLEGNAFKFRFSDVITFLNGVYATKAEMTTALAQLSQYTTKGYVDSLVGQSAKKTYVDAKDAEIMALINGINKGSLNVYPTDSPSNGIDVYNALVAGTYTNFGGFVVTPEEIGSNLVRLIRRKGVWEKILVAIPLTGFAPVFSNDLNATTSGRKLMVSTGSDGKYHLSNIIDANAGTMVTATETLEIPGAIDNIMYWSYGTKTFKRDYEFEVKSEWFNIVGDDSTDNTLNWKAAMDYLTAEGGGLFVVSIGTYLMDAFSLPAKVSLRGASLGSTTLKLKSGSTADVFIDLDVAYSGCIEDFTIDGNRANQIKEIHGIRLMAAGGNSNYMFMVRRNYVRFCSGDGIHAVSPSFIFSVQSNRIRDCAGYGIYNSSTDNGFFDNNTSVCDKGGIYNIGGNTRFIGGKQLFNGSAAYPDSAGVTDASARSSYADIECQENYYHGFYFKGSENCIFTGLVSDMNNVARRPLSLGGLSNIGDPNAIGYALKATDIWKCIVQMVITSAAPSTSLKFTQFGKYIDASCSDNIFEITQQGQYGPDTILSGTKNRWVRHDNYAVGSNQAAPVPAYTVNEVDNDVILISAITADTAIILPLANQTTIKTLRITNRLAVNNLNRWYISNVPIGIPSGTAVSPFKLTPNSITEFAAVNSGADGQWRCVNVTKLTDPDLLELSTNKSNTQTLWDSTTLYPTKNAVYQLLATGIPAVGSLITKNGGYTILAADFGKNTVLTVLVDASSNAVSLILSSAPSSTGFIINLVRLDSSANTVTLNGRTVGSVKEPINGDNTNAYILHKDRPAVLVSDGVGWRSVNNEGVPRIFKIPGFTVMTSALLNSTYPIAQYPVNSVLRFINQGKQYVREESNVWIESTFTIVA